MFSASGIVVILGIMEFSARQAPLAHPPTLSHASMDVANIISIVIPDNPEENINVDRLIDEFRQRLERIKKQSRVSKVEHAPISPVRTRPEMSQEERRKVLQLPRRGLHGRTALNPGGSRNWTREARRLEESREGYLRGRLPAIHRDYEEHRSHGNLASDEGEEYRRIGESRASLDRRGDIPRREDGVRQMIRREDAERREDAAFFVDEEAKKIARHSRDWGNRNWREQVHDNGRIYPVGSSIDRQHKFNPLIRQRDAGNENVKFDKTQHPNSPGAMSANCPRANKRIPARYPTREEIDGAKRSVGDFRSFERTDGRSSFVDYPKGIGFDEGINPNCNEAASNRTDRAPRDPRSMIQDAHFQNSPNFQTVDHGNARKAFRDLGDESENVAAFENMLSENLGNYVINKSKKKGRTVKKKRGPAYPKDPRGLASVGHQELGHSWNYHGRLATNFPDGPANFNEIFAQRFSGSAASDDQTASGVFQLTDNGNKIADPFDYDSARLSLRMQRATNATAASAGRIPKVYLDKHVVERLKRLLKISPQPPVLSYKRVVLVYGNVNGSLVDGNDEAISQEAEKFEASPSDDPTMRAPPYPSSKFAMDPI